MEVEIWFLPCHSHEPRLSRCYVFHLTLTITRGEGGAKESTEEDGGGRVEEL